MEKRICLKKGWEILLLNKTYINISTANKKINKKECIDFGKYPVIDQGNDFIGGYSNADDLLIEDLPIIIFGDHTRIVKYVNFKFIPGADGTKLMKPLSIFDPKLFFYFLSFIAKKIDDRGYSRHFQYLNKESIPIPPLNEQKRIVDKIESLFSKLDNGVTELQNLQEKLKVYRQSVLKSAFEGKLTEKWREENKDNIEPASVLLEKIKKEKEEYNKKNNIKETKLPPINRDELPDIPDDWEWCRLVDTCIKIGSGSTPKGGKKVYLNKGIKFIRSQNVWNNEFRIDDIVFINEEINNKMKNTIVEPEDILLNITGASIGRSCLVPKTFDVGNVNQHVSIIRPVRKIFSKFFHKMIITPFYFKYVMDKQTGVSREGLTKENIRKSCIPFPSLEEQNQIVSEIDKHYTIIDILEEYIERSLKQAEKLKHSILKKAFEGKLVEQDPNDESAEKLLEKIKIEKEIYEKEQKKLKKNKEKNLNFLRLRLHVL